MNSIKIVVSSDPSFLGEAATRADIERHAEALLGVVLVQCVGAYCDTDAEIDVDVSIGEASGASAQVSANMGDSTFEGVADPDRVKVLRRTLETQIEQHVREIAGRVWPFA